MFCSGRFFFRTDGILWLLEKEGVVGRAVAYSATCRALSRSYPFCCSVPNFTFGSEVIASLILSSTATVQARAAKLIRAGPIRCFRFWWISSDHAHPIQDGNGYPKPEYPMVLPDKKTGMERVFYPWVRYWVKSSSHRVWRVRVWMYTTHARLPAGKKYPQKIS